MLLTEKDLLPIQLQQYLGTATIPEIDQPVSKAADTDDVRRDEASDIQQDFDSVAAAQQQDLLAKEIVRHIQAETTPEAKQIPSTLWSRLCKRFSSFQLINGVLFPTKEINGMTQQRLVCPRIM